MPRRFAVGALIAHVKHYAGDLAVRRLAWMLAAVGSAGLVLSVLALPRVIAGDAAHRIGHTFLVIFYGGVVAGAAHGFGGVLGNVLSFGPVVYLGTVSYGLYVYHYFAPIAIGWLAGKWGAEMLQRPAVAVIAYTLFTVIVSVVSWHWLEARINRLKSRFPYPRAQHASATQRDNSGRALSKAVDPA